MKKEFIVERQGRAFVLYAGLLDLAHQQGLKSVRTELVQTPSEANNRVAICTATVVLERDGQERIFTGIGDAAPNNVAPAMATCLIRMAECVPLSARILTRTGWKGYDALRIGEEVLAYHVETDTCRWTPLLAVSVFDDDYETITLRSRSFSATCTPNHSWAVTSQPGRRRMRQAQELTRADRIVVAAVAESGSHPLSPREAAILGWIATDGTIRYQRIGHKSYWRITIAQSKPDMIEKLRALLADDATLQFNKGAYEREFPGGKTYMCLPSYRFELNAAFARKLLEKAEFSTFAELPRLVTQLSREARHQMLEAMLDGDGFRGSVSRTRLFAQKAKPGVMETFELLATLEGFALGASRRTARGDLPLRAVRRNRLIAADYLKVEAGVPQPVWCPTTAFGTWVMEMSGCITITGNTRAKARALRDAVNVGVAAFEELGEEGAHDGAPERGYALGPARISRAERNAPPSRAVTARPAAKPAPEEGTPIPVEMRNSGVQPITEAQSEAVRSLCRRGGMEPDAVARDRFQAESLSGLSQAQASELIRALNERSNGRTTSAA